MEEGVIVRNGGEGAGEGWKGGDMEGSPHIFNINHFVIKTSSDMGCRL
jgi:hypothetical protein